MLTNCRYSLSILIRNLLQRCELLHLHLHPAHVDAREIHMQISIIPNTILLHLLLNRFQQTLSAIQELYNGRKGS